MDDAAQAIGDPNKQRVQLSQWVSIYNRSNRELCEKANVLKFQDEFDLIAGQRKYDWPELMTVMTDIHVSETPGDETTWRYLKEIFEDEFRDRTDRLYPSATLPDNYHATESWFWLVPMVSAEIQGGACITYFGLPDRVTQDQVTSGTVLQVPDMAQDYLLRRMIIHGKMSRNRIVEAKVELELWNADMESFQDKLDDRSDDRRSSLAPRKSRYSGMR
jgi:hypothetical protein